MKLLFGAQFYTPSIGGVQEVMQCLAEEMVKKGHNVTIVTSVSADRDFDELNGVTIKDFDITGNEANGLIGEVSAFQDYVINGEFDLIMVMAAQQWTFDALAPILDKLTRTKKVFIPCGFSGLFDPSYKKYFDKMPEILAKFDHLIFFSTKYRDIDFAKQHRLGPMSIIPSAAREEEFNTEQDLTFRLRHDIDDNSFVFLTVGSFTGIKGHLELVKAFALLDLPDDEHATLMLNGTFTHVKMGGAKGLTSKLLNLVRTRGIGYLIKRAFNKVSGSSMMIDKLAREVNETSPNKRVIITDFGKSELTQAYKNADLFVFASNIEYSPLVLFETAAAGVPFLSVTVGNTPEIADWTGAGVICPSTIDEQGYTRVDELVLAREMRQLMTQKDLLFELGKAGRGNWKNKFTWSIIAARYEEIFVELVGGNAS